MKRIITFIITLISIICLFGCNMNNVELEAIANILTLEEAYNNGWFYNEDVENVHNLFVNNQSLQLNEKTKKFIKNAYLIDKKIGNYQSYKNIINEDINVIDYYGVINQCLIARVEDPITNNTQHEKEISIANYKFTYTDSFIIVIVPLNNNPQIVDNSRKDILYNAKIIEWGKMSPEGMLKSVIFDYDFLKANLIGGSVPYINEDYDANDQTSMEYLYFDDQPTSRTIIIKNDEEYNQVFINTSEYDLSKKIIIVYLYEKLSQDKPFLKKTTIENEELIIVFGDSNVSTAPIPGLGYIVFESDYCEFSNVNLISEK